MSKYLWTLTKQKYFFWRHMTEYLIVVPKFWKPPQTISFIFLWRQSIERESSDISTKREWGKHAITEGNYFSFSFRIGKLIINMRLLLAFIVQVFLCVHHHDVSILFLINKQWSVLSFPPTQLLIFGGIIPSFLQKWCLQEVNFTLQDDCKNPSSSNISADRKPNQGLLF